MNDECPVVVKEENLSPGKSISSDEEKAQVILLELESRGPVRYGEVLSCQLCNKSFTYRNGLIRHIRTLHLKEKPFKCEVCERSFGYKNILIEHQNLHYGIKPYSCTHCGKRFAARSNLVQHRVSHKNSFNCHLCYKVFEKAGEFKRHLMDSHPKGTLECGSCDFVAKSQRQLSQHVMSNHVRNAGTEIGRSSTESDSPIKQRSPVVSPVKQSPVISPCPLPSIHTFQSLQNQPPQNESPFFTSHNDYHGIPHGQNYNRNFAHAIKTEPNPSCSYATSNFNPPNMFVKQEPLSPSHFRTPSTLPYGMHNLKTEHGSINSNSLSPDFSHYLNPTLSSPGKRSIIQSMQSPPSYDNNPVTKYPRLTPSVESPTSAMSPPVMIPSNITSPDITLPSDITHVMSPPLLSAADSTTNVADLMNSLQSWMNRWNESSVPGAPQISITITPRSTHPSPDGTPARNPLPLPDVEQVIAQEIELGRLFECRYCGVLFRERGLYFLHASLHDATTPFRCSICHTTCSDKNDFHLHFVNQPHHD